MKRFVTLLLLACMTALTLLAAVSCGHKSDAAGGVGDAIKCPVGTYGDADPDAPGKDPEEGDKDKPEPVRPAAGSITACAWDDNAYYDYYRTLFEQGKVDEDGIKGPNGRFFNYPGEDWHLDTSKRLVVTVTTGETPVAGAKVMGKNADGETVGIAVTDARGIAYLYLSDDAAEIMATSGEAVASAQPAGDGTVTVSLGDNTALKQNILQLMFVVDVTGSMGDELNYLQKEIEYVINAVAKNDSDTTIQLALLFYRDDGDTEKFAYHDFVDVTDETNLRNMQNKLATQQATGGGDYPEAVDEALEMAVSKQWYDGTATKLIFHVLDAPPHQKEVNRDRYGAAVKSAVEKGIRICPILASGSGLLCEYLTRQTAALTGGRFIYVTNHSGIGNAHYDPDIPNAVVEYLNAMLVRLILGYHTGTFADPIPWNTVTDGGTAETPTKTE